MHALINHVNTVNVSISNWAVISLEAFVNITLKEDLSLVNVCLSNATLIPDFPDYREGGVLFYEELSYAGILSIPSW